jgi:di/tricarboxylate transporter
LERFGVEFWITIVVLALMFVSLAREIAPADVTMFSGLVVLWAGGVIDDREALAGFSNPMVIAIGMLFVVSAAMRDTGALSWITRQMLGAELDRKRVFARMLGPTAVLSAFLNNTPLVAMFTPAVRDWAIRHGRAPSKFLIPLSFAAILGGTTTLIGTSTNLVVSGLLEERGYPGFTMFELSWVGVPLTIVGVTFLLLFSKRLLPARRGPDQAAREGDREYCVTMELGADYAFNNRTVEAAGLRHLKGLFLAEIERAHVRIVPVRPTNHLREGDRLVFYGVADTVVELAKTPGLNTVADDDEGPSTSTGPRQIYEVVISATSPLVGQTLREAGFRRRYDAAVMAIHRNGERLKEKLGNTDLRSGDTLMVEGSPGFRATWANSGDFYLVAQLADVGEQPRAKASFALVVLIGMVTLVATNTWGIALASAVAALLLIAARAIRPSAARRSIDLSVLVVIASAFGLSAAVESSGVAASIAEMLAHVVQHWRPWLSLAAVYLLTSFCTEVLSNTAAAALVLPIAIATADQLERDPRPFAVAVAVAASLSFLTPFGYQTNLLVYGPGGYKFSDFARVGAPLAVLCFIVAMVAIPMHWGWGM